MKKSFTKDDLDRFYTNDNLVDSLLKEIDINKYELVIEPSAGGGAFSNKIPNCLAFDIKPQHSSIIQQDFLQYKYTGDIKREKILCIGNPPYGRQSSLALKFIKKCTDFADTIAFILPLSFKKPSVQIKVPLAYSVDKQIDLNWDSFTLNGNPYEVPCVFQIWNNKYKKRIIEPPIRSVGYNYVNKDGDPHFTIRRVGVYAGRAFFDLNKCEQSHYFIQTYPTLPTSRLSQVINRLNDYVWMHNNTVGPRSISKPELNTVLNPIIADAMSL